MFVAGLLIPICFWFLDAVAYFYQVKIRGVMDRIRDRLMNRSTQHLVQSNFQPVIEKVRVTRSQGRRIIDAVFNHSMWLYYILILTDIALWLAFQGGIAG